MKISSDVKTIGNFAFQGCASLTLSSIAFSSESTCIGCGTFARCSSLTSVDIPKGDGVIYPYTFCGCIMLKSIVIKNGMKSIGNYAFYGCSSLDSVRIPSTVKHIGAFAFCGCDYKKALIFDSPEGWKYADDNIDDEPNSCAEEDEIIADTQNAVDLFTICAGKRGIEKI